MTSFFRYHNTPVVPEEENRAVKNSPATCYNITYEERLGVVRAVLKETNFYQILGVDSQASATEIRRAYIKVFLYQVV